MHMLARRGYVGKTFSISKPGEDPVLDLSLPTLSSDFVNLLVTLYPDPSVAPTFIVSMSVAAAAVYARTVHTSFQLVGHSMGGAVITRASSTLLEKKYRVGGIAVLDVVEGTFPPVYKHALSCKRVMYFYVSSVTQDRPSRLSLACILCSILDRTGSRVLNRPSNGSELVPNSGDPHGTHGNGNIDQHNWTYRINYTE